MGHMTRIKLRLFSGLAALALVCSVGIVDAKASSVNFAPDQATDASAIVNQLAAGQYDAVVSHFADHLKREMPARVISARWQAFVDSLGVYKGQLGYNQRKFGNGVAVIVRCQMDHGTVDVDVDYDSAGLIGSFAIRTSNPSLDIKPPT
jgi:hypothetical protein